MGGMASVCLSHSPTWLFSTILGSWQSITVLERSQYSFPLTFSLTRQAGQLWIRVVFGKTIPIKDSPSLLLREFSTILAYLSFSIPLRLLWLRCGWYLFKPNFTSSLLIRSNPGPFYTNKQLYKCKLRFVILLHHIPT